MLNMKYKDVKQQQQVDQQRATKLEQELRQLRKLYAVTAQKYDNLTAQFNKYRLEQQ